MRPLVRSYGVISTRTLSPASTRMRFFRIRPAVWAMISCSFSSFTRNVAFGSNSVTTPGNSSSSSLAIDIHVRVRRSPSRLRSFGVLSVREWPRKLAETSGVHNTVERPSARSNVACRCPSEPGLDPFQELIANGPIGVELLLAAAAYHGRIRGRPVFDLDRQPSRELEGLVVRFRRERHDHVEIEPFQLVELLDRDRPVALDVEPDLLHHGDRKRIELPLAHTGGTHIGAPTEELAEQRRRHGRADRVEPADEQHRVGLEGARCRHAG